ncbi:MAG: MarR family transcriptional regulator, partial [Proteobacteria bacterium]|nr:MarR family transcriptional regulator [Pseudomonadota bacterium]
DRLEKDGWIEREADKTDRRSLRIYLTPSAKEQKQPIMNLFQLVNQKFLDNFTREEWGQLQDFLNRLDRKSVII